ncbi:MAG: UbiH/UbiF family hydroxylase [Proteobacteria bacterium]|nr:UbiH/UbiF family hydroxylase [Pseudomonadota bacterium]
MKFDVIVVGGGLAGAALAVALRKTRLRVALIDAQAPTRPQGWDARIYAYSPSNAAFLEELGIWQHLDPQRLSAIHEMRIFGDAGGELSFSAYHSGVGELAWIGESSLVHLELWESLKRQHNVTLLCPARPAALEQGDDAVRLRLDDGRHIEAALLVGADGRDSWVREQAGIAATVRPYEESGVVANFTCERSHGQTAYQWFMREGILAWLPLPGKQISIVWSARSDFADELMALDDLAFSERVAAAGGHRLGRLSLMTKRAAFPLRLLRVSQMVRPRVALVGDAAHAIHPLSGHGINLGFQDVKALAGRLERMQPWEDPGDLSVLRAYARSRAEEPFVLQYATHGLNRLFAARTPFLSDLRNAGMNLTSHLPVVGDALVRYAINGRF